MPPPLKVTVLVEGVNVPVPVKSLPILIADAPVHVKAFLAAVPGMLIVPLTVNVPVLIVTKLSSVLVSVIERVRLEHDTIPVPIANVWLTLAVGFVKIISPETLREKAPLIVSKLFTLLAAKVMELHSAPVAFTVTVMPELIVTASAEVGTAAPPQVAVSCQSPLTLAMRCANTRGPVRRKKKRLYLL